MNIEHEESRESIKQEITVRVGNPEDAQRVAVLYKETWRATYPNTEYGVTQKDINEKTEDWDDEERIEKWREGLAPGNENSLALIAEIGEEIAGSGRFNKVEGEYNKLQSLYVHPDCQGKGVALLLHRRGLNGSAKKSR